MTNPQAAGVQCVASDGRQLFLKRAGEGDHFGQWCFPGGGVDGDETPVQAAVRELREETKHDGHDNLAADLKSLGTVPAGSARGWDYTTFRYDVAEPFEPELNEEHSEAMWARPEDAPEPLHPGVKTLLSFQSGKAKSANDSLAMDRASVRSYDDNGRLRVEQANISKANVCPYRGAEIVDFEELGLDPEKIYQLFRDPAALEIAAPTFNGVPILDTHVPSTAWDHPSGKVVGTTGTDAVWEAPYLKNSLIIWTADAIQGIENKTKQELSCGYKYRAVMEPGDYEGVKYSGRMIEILGNHVALVSTGRAGPDVIVGDSQLEIKETGMSKKALSRMAQLARGALMASLRPVLAADAKLDLNVVLQDVTKANWKASKARIAAAIKPKLAADAGLEDIVKLLDTLDAVEGTDDMPPEDTPPVNDADPVQEVLAMLKGKVDDSVIAGIADKLKGMTPAAASDEFPLKKPDGADADVKDADKDAPKVTKQAMDAALKAASSDADKRIKLAADEAETRTVARLNAIADAREAVQPYVGKLAMSFDSAEGVYRAALGTLGVKHEGIHESALRAVLEAQQKPGATRKTLATDSAPPQGFAERFPGVAGMRTI